MRQLSNFTDTELAAVSMTKETIGKYRVYTLEWVLKGSLHVYCFSSYFKHLTMVGVRMREDVRLGIVSEAQMDFAKSILPRKIRRALND